MVKHVFQSPVIAAIENRKTKLRCDILFGCKINSKNECNSKVEDLFYYKPRKHDCGLSNNEKDKEILLTPSVAWFRDNWEQFCDNVKDKIVYIKTFNELDDIRSYVKSIYDNDSNDFYREYDECSDSCTLFHVKDCADCAILIHKEPTRIFFLCVYADGKVWIERSALKKENGRWVVIKYLNSDNEDEQKTFKDLDEDDLMLQAICHSSLFHFISQNERIIKYGDIFSSSVTNKGYYSHHIYLHVYNQ